MPVYRPWQYAQRAVVRQRDTAAFRNNAAVYEEQNPVAPAPVNPLDQVRSGWTGAPLAPSRKGGGGLFGKLKDIGGDALGAAEDVGMGAMNVPYEATRTVAQIALGGGGTNKGRYQAGTDAQGNPIYGRSGGGLSATLEGWKNQLTQNPLDTIRNAARAGAEADTSIAEHGIGGYNPKVGNVPILATTERALGDPLNALAGAGAASAGVRLTRAVATGLGYSFGTGIAADKAKDLPGWRDLSPAVQQAVIMGTAYVGGHYAPKVLKGAKSALKVPGSLEPLGATVSAAGGPTKRADIVRVAHGDVKARPDLFQARDVPEGLATDPARVKQIVDNFDPNQLEPGLLVNDTSTGDLVVLRGHHRLEAQRQLADAGKFPKEGTWEVVDADLSNPAHVSQLRELAATSNYTTAATNIREDIRTYRTLKDTGNEHGAIQAKMRKTNQQADDLKHLSGMPSDIVDRLVQEPALTGTAAEIARARNAYGLTDADVQDLWKRYSEVAVTRSDLRGRLNEVGSTLAERRAKGAGGGMFAGTDWEATNATVLDAIDEMGKTRAELASAHKKLVSLDGQLKGLEGDPEMAADVKAVRDKLTGRIAGAQGRLKQAEDSYAAARKYQFETGDPGGSAGSGVPGADVQAHPGEQGAGGTVKRKDLFGNVTDTFQTEAELAGIRATQGGMDIGGAEAAKRAGIEGAPTPAEVRPTATTDATGSGEFIGYRGVTAPGRTPDQPNLSRPRSIMDVMGQPPGPEVPKAEFYYFAPDEGLAKRYSLQDQKELAGFGGTANEQLDKFRVLYGREPGTAEVQQFKIKANKVLDLTPLGKNWDTHEKVREFLEGKGFTRAEGDAVLEQVFFDPDSATGNTFALFRNYDESYRAGDAMRTAMEAHGYDAARIASYGGDEVIALKPEQFVRVDVPDITRATGEGRPTGGVGGDVGQGDMIPPRAPGEPGTPSGAPQAPLGQEAPGVDLIGGQARDALMATESKFLASKGGKVEQGIRQFLSRMGLKGLAPNLVRDPKFTPVWQEMNRVQNLRESFKAVVENMWAEVEKSGLKLEQQADGNWFVAGTKQHLGDVVEKATPEAKAVWDSFSPRTQEVLTDMTTLMDEARQTVEHHGGDMPLIDVEGAYFPRKVAAIAGQEKTTGVNTARRQGANQNFQKSRTEANMANAANTDRVTYAHPLDAFTAGLDAKLRASQDAYVAGLLKPLAVPNAKAGFGGLKDIPGVGVLNEADARRANAGLTPRAPGAIDKVIGGFNQALTPIRASWDASGLGQQGMRRWLTDPVGAARDWKTAVKSLRDPAVYQAAMREYDQAGPGLKYLARHNLRMTSEGAANEVTRLETSGPTRAAGSKLKAAYDTGMRVSAEIYDRPLNLHRVSAANAMYARLVAKGLKGAALDAEMDKGALAINRMYGWSANRPASIESAALFAPRYFRAQVESVVKAFTDKGIEGSEARKHLGALAAEGTILVVGMNAARGYDTKFDPRSTNFMTIRNVAGLDVSPFGSYGLLMRAVAGTIGGESGGPIRPDIGRLGKLAWGKASPAMKLIIEPLKGQTYMGKPLDPTGNPVGFAWEQFKSSVPFGAQNLIEDMQAGKPVQAVKSALVGSLGVSQQPTTPSELRDFRRDELARKAGGSDYASLPGSQKAQINEDAGVRKLQAEADSNTLTRAGDRSKSTKATLDAAKKIDALSAGLEAGQLTGPEWRKQYQTIQAELRGARDTLTINGKKDAALEGWYALYDKASGEDGRLNYDLLDNLQAAYRAAHPGIDAKVDQVTGAHDNATMREYRQASKLANDYYAIPAYRGMSAADGQKAGMVLAAASDMVAFGQARDKDAALRKIATIDPGGVQLAKQASRRGSNPARAKFRKDPANALYAKFYGSAPVVTSVAPA